MARSVTDAISKSQREIAARTGMPPTSCHSTTLLQEPVYPAPYNTGIQVRHCHLLCARAKITTHICDANHKKIQMLQKSNRLYFYK